ncbi:glycosyltransferase family 2 protein [Falsiroseomonas sp.]|uniref:glycosyltransferase family 2 protein n=1 Tax=Falsiroseomonas sp. TaxID=2870721 RepID=UPI00356386A0
MTGLPARLRGAIAALLRGRPQPASAPQAPRTRLTYAEWVARHGTPGPAALARLAACLGERPARVSVLMAAGEHDMAAVTASLASLQAQLHPDWELCLAAPADLVLPAEPRLRRVAGSGLDAAWGLAGGDLAIVLEPGDLLAPEALAAATLDLAAAPEARLVYADEDRLDAAGRRTDPWFKGGWNPDLFRAQAYALRPCVIRRVALEAVGGLAGPPGAELYATLLRLAEGAPAGAIRHLPLVLLHRRADAPSEEPAAHAAALSAHLAATAPGARVETLPQGGWRRVVWPLPATPPRMSLCIPTRDRVALLEGCVEGLRHRTDWPDLEILVVDNDSAEAATREYLDSLADDPRVRVLRETGPFNFSRLNNLGAAAASGTLFGLVNNDIAVREPGWLREMAGHALRPEVGAVGALLHYGDGTVQHAGIVLGIGGVGSHIHKRLAGAAPGYQGRVAVAQEVAAVTAACLLTPIATWRRLGGLDEAKLPVAYNDVDYCLRVREAGLRVVFTPHAVLDHLESASRGLDDGGARRARLERDKDWMRGRWGALLDADPFYSPNLALDATDCRLAAQPRWRPGWMQSA